MFGLFRVGYEERRLDPKLETSMRNEDIKKDMMTCLLRNYEERMLVSRNQTIETSRKNEDIKKDMMLS